MSKYGIKSYILEINGEEIGNKMYPISTIIKALQEYETEYGRVVGALSGKKTVEEIVEEMIESK